MLTPTTLAQWAALTKEQQDGIMLDWALDEKTIAILVEFTPDAGQVDICARMLRRRDAYIERRMMQIAEFLAVLHSKTYNGLGGPKT